MFFLKILWFFWTLPVLLERWCSTCPVCVHTLTPRENRERQESRIFLNLRKKTQYLMNTLYIFEIWNVENWWINNSALGSQGRGDLYRCVVYYTGAATKIWRDVRFLAFSYTVVDEEGSCVAKMSSRNFYRSPDLGEMSKWHLSISTRVTVDSKIVEK